jgi:hypothetical protein
MPLTPGSRWRSTVCATEVIVVRCVAAAVQLDCGGAAMVPHGSGQPEGEVIGAGAGSGTQIGKRYASEDGGVEVLCTKSGRGGLSMGGVPLVVKGAKPLPASD